MLCNITTLDTIVVTLPPGYLLRTPRPPPPFPAPQVTTGVVVIVVDLSDPAGLLPTLMWWIEAVKRKLGATYEKFEKKGLQLPEQLRQRAKSKLYSANEDKDAVYHSGISLVIAATKYDAFKNQDPEVKKVMSRCGRGGRGSLGSGEQVALPWACAQLVTA